MSIADCPHHPQCGHRAESQCDADGATDERPVKVTERALTTGEIVSTWMRAKNEAMIHLTLEQKILHIANAILDADQAARQAAMVKGLNLIDVYNKAIATFADINDLGDSFKIAFLTSVMEQITDFKTTPSSGPVPAIEKLEALHESTKRNFTEDEFYVAEHMLQIGFEMVNDDATVYGCTLGQVLELLTARKQRIPEDFLSHQDSWRNALIKARDTAPPATVDSDDAGYWAHELRAYDRAYAELGLIPHAVQQELKHDKMVDAAARMEATTGYPAATALQQMHALDASLKNNAFAKMAKELKSVNYKSVLGFCTVPIAGKSWLRLSGTGHLVIGTGKESCAIKLDPMQYDLVHEGIRRAVRKMVDETEKPVSPAEPQYGEPYVEKGQRNVKITSSGAAVDQDYPWNYDMAACPEGKVQLLSIGGLPTHGKKSDSPGFYRAWAPMPKDMGPKPGVPTPNAMWQVNRD